MKRLIEGKKFKKVLCTRVTSGDLICYDGKSLIGYGIADTEDLRFIDNELNICIVIGNVFDALRNETMLSYLSNKVVKFLIDYRVIDESQKHVFKKEVECEIQDFLAVFLKSEERQINLEKLGVLGV